MASDWECVPRSYEVTKNYLQSFHTFDHPLKVSTVTMVDSKGTRVSSSSISLLNDPLLLTLDGTDPLSQFARQEQELIDPLTQMASEYETFQKSKTKKREKDVSLADDSFNWNAKRLSILNKFTTSEKLSISTSFLSVSNAGTGTDAIKVHTVVSDKLKFRLEQLDDFEDTSIRHLMDLTQQDYIQRIEQLNQELVQSWHNDQRVKALKIAIQCSKMLSDTSVLSFYPSQFVLITDILDIFGKLVYERLKQKAYSGPESSRQLNTESARDTCQNWFFKVASIRELLPRLYVEIAILKCYEFLNECSYENILQRLTLMIRGIGDPLIAVYVRCYLVRIGATVTSIKEYMYNNFKDFLTIYQSNQMIFAGSIRSELNRQRVDMTKYLSLYGPAVNFILQAVAYKNNFYTEEIVKQVKTIKNNGPILMAILQALTSEFIAARASEIVHLLSQSHTEGISKSQLFRALGLSMSVCVPLCEERSGFLKEAFLTINTFTDPSEYITCVETWSQFIASNFPISETNRLLHEIITRLSSTKICEKHFQQLHNILDKILENQKNIELLLIQENFLPFLDLFHKDAVKSEACKRILIVYKRNSHEYTTDPVVISALMYIGKILNDSLTALTVADEKRQISQLISNFIRKVYFGRDLECQLSFYVEARGTFSNLDTVYGTLVQNVNKLAMEAYSIVHSQRTRKTQAFAKACIAFSFITIPSISCICQQMDLYMLSGQVALVNQCMGQADACFEAALNLIAELPTALEIDGKVKPMDSYVVSYLSNMLATLVVVPDSPEEGVLYLLRLLLDVIQKFSFAANSLGPVTVYLNVLDMLYVQSLEDFPYHITGVISNDELYGRDPKFLNEVNNLCVYVVEKILQQLKQLGAEQQYKMQTILSLELMLRIIRYANLYKEQTFQLALNLWLLARKHESLLDVKHFPRIIKAIENIYNLTKDTNTKHAQSLHQFMEHINHK
ncbi:VPS35 endosomal protein sorting factor-like isoform X2 [Glossina fuscipes]|uniref:VPS35 endosomal protein sorting factor-like isoform X2 n=1 Tax=Glossina fuscipes TaxID=7396 RepID=A0A9C6DYG4_9MUSC|nr:VPS35 endosomal protein sorting factor-like isoform X2 [Glossina fuscipes]